MKFIIKEYIDKITTQDILRFGLENGVSLEKEDADILYFYLKNNWEDLLYGSPLPIISKIEDKLGKTKCKIISDLFYMYKEKYKDYL